MLIVDVFLFTHFYCRTPHFCASRCSLLRLETRLIDIMTTKIGRVENSHTWHTVEVVNSEQCQASKEQNKTIQINNNFFSRVLNLTRRTAYPAECWTIFSCFSGSSYTKANNFFFCNYCLFWLSVCCLLSSLSSWKLKSSSTMDG